MAFNSPSIKKKSPTNEPDLNHTFDANDSVFNLNSSHSLRKRIESNESIVAKNKNTKLAKKYAESKLKSFLLDRYEKKLIDSNLTDYTNLINGLNARDIEFYCEISTNLVMNVLKQTHQAENRMYDNMMEFCKSIFPIDENSSSDS